MPFRNPTRCALAVGLYTILALALAACAPFTATPPAAGQATRIATAAATNDATAEPLFAGTVMHAGQPVPNGRVELRSLGWAANKTPAVATIQADDQGRFSLPNPPLGDFSVIGFFADGEMDAGGWPPITIQAGRQIQGFVVPIERKLVQLAPIADAPAPMPLTLTWHPADEATQYQVWVIDAGTTEIMLDKTTAETTLAGPPDLKPGAYQWVVNALNAEGQVVAMGQETFTIK